jgi:hypothetical protein
MVVGAIVRVNYKDTTVQRLRIVELSGNNATAACGSQSSCGSYGMHDDGA